MPAVKAGAAALPAGAGPRQAWCTVLQTALAQALPNAAEIAAGTDAPEHLHQLRVALRRLRSALRWFAEWGGDAEAAHALEADWREPFGRLGAARDSDVLVHGLQPALQAAGAPPFDAMPAVADGGPGEIVRGMEFTGLLLRTLAVSLPPASRRRRRQRRAGRGRVPRGAPCLAPRDEGRRGLRRCQRGRAAPHAQALKRFRYGLEFLMPLLARKPARRLHRAACAALDALGHFNDLHTAETHFRACAQSDARAWFAVGWVVASQPQARAAAARALTRMARLDASPLPWRRLGQRGQRKPAA